MNATEAKKREKDTLAICCYGSAGYYSNITYSCNTPEIGHSALAILVFAIILWMSEAVSYPVSSAMIIGLVAIILGMGPTLGRIDCHARHGCGAENGIGGLQ